MAVNHTPLRAPGVVRWPVKEALRRELLGVLNASFLFKPTAGDGGGSEIPDSGGGHYAKNLSLTDGESVTTWSDAIGDIGDLSAGSAPTFVESGINGYPSVEFSVDYLDAPSFPIQSQPNAFVIVYQPSTTSDNVVVDHRSDTEDRHVHSHTTNGYLINAGSSVEGGTVTTDPTVATVRFDSTASYIRINGSEVTNGDVGAQSLESLRVGDDRNLSTSFSGQIAAISTIIDPANDDPIAEEERLAGEYDIALA